MNGIKDTKNESSILKNDERMYVYHVINTNVIDTYCVYKLDPIASSRDNTFTIQNVLFGAMQITKNATDNSKNIYKGYGICFDERGEFGYTIIHDHTMITQ